MNNERPLPSEFDVLKAHLDWALDTESARNKKRLNSNMHDMTEFYQAMHSHLDDILRHLSDFDLDNLPDAETNLLNMCFSLSEVSFAVEVYEQGEVPNSIQELGEADRFKIMHE